MFWSFMTAICWFPRLTLVKRLRQISLGHKVCRLHRFIFYLREQDTSQVFSTNDFPTAPDFEMVRHNCEGGSLVCDRDTYFALGGHDESFIGWGGEDNEMFDRCRADKCFPFGYLPFVHLYHSPQPRPADPDRFQARLRERLGIPAETRIRELAARSFGDLSGPYIPAENNMAASTAGGL